MNTIFFVFLSTLVLGANCVIVQLKDGYINGTTETTKEGRLFHKFLRIPYAKPPVGSLRFQPPEPVEPWTGIKDATQPPPMCIQKSMTALNSSLIKPGIGQEDCLYLNVIVPEELFNPSGKVPVIVGIHGGAFQAGSSNDFAGDYFMERDVIFVSINYRLGALGFLAMNGFPSMDNDLISGNFGLKDQSLALRWVKENIAHFGGDPGNVTLLGESAGAVSVHFHMFSPLSKGLFQKAIMESGNAFVPWSHFPSRFTLPIENKQQRLDQLFASILLKSTKCLNNSNTLKCLQEIPVDYFTTPTGGIEDLIAFIPIIELNVSKEKAFLPVEPDASNYQTLVPWLTGMNSAEGAIIVPTLLRNGSYFAKMMNLYKNVSLPLLNFYIISANASDLPNITNKVNEFYFGAEDIGLETGPNVAEMITDSSWLNPLKKTVISGPNLQYLYLYDHRGTFSITDNRNITADLGVSHADELPMLFRIEELEAKRSIEDRRVSDKMLKFWINFAISEDPNRHSKEKLWQPVQTKDKTFEYLHIKSDGVTMKRNLYQERYDFWESLPIGK